MYRTETGRTLAYARQASPRNHRRRRRYARLLAYRQQREPKGPRRTWNYTKLMSLYANKRTYHRCTKYKLTEYKSSMNQTKRSRNSQSLPCLANSRMHSPSMHPLARLRPPPSAPSDLPPKRPVTCEFPATFQSAM